MKVHYLDNGLRVVLAPMKGLTSVTALAMIGVGSRYESPDKAGISHFLEHMVFKGTKQWPTAFDLSVAVDGIGADFNAFTGKEYTGFYVTTTHNHLDFALSAISDMLYTPKLREADLEREKGVIVEEINMYRDQPQEVVAEIFDGAMYGPTGLGRPIIGTRQTVTSFKQADFKEHLKAWYGLDNSCVVLAGDARAFAKEDVLLEQINQHFSKGLTYGDTVIKRELGYLEAGEVDVTMQCKQCDQAHFIVGYPAFDITHPDRYALSMLSIILGGNMSSRLFTEVREKRGLAYYAHSGVDRYLDTGSFHAVEGVDINRIDEAVQVTLEVFNQVAENGKHKVTELELARAKEFMAGQMLLSLERSRSVAQFWASRVVLGDSVISPDQVLERVRAVTLDDVVRVAQTVINPSKLVFAVVGPFEDKGKFSKLLKN